MFCLKTYLSSIAECDLANISSGVDGCTFTSSCYSVNFLGTAFNVYDTAGLDEGQSGTVPKQEAIVQLFRLLRSLDSGVNLLVFCMRGPRIKEAAHKNWRLFYEIICRRQVPIILAVTGLEQETDMDGWWVRNKGAFQRYEMYPHGVACITAMRGKLLKSGAHRLDDEYAESTLKMQTLINSTCLEHAWKVSPLEWLRDIVTVSYESRFCGDTIEHRHVSTITGAAVQELIDRCEMSSEEARKIGEVLSQV
ncbi:hypothetical protein DXG03_005976 [Asterophora parasitica]|uniref:Uncharacterized protein n=1 Tax=Asterophora parasitica TaxID=117018 RepID=A0A9P7K8H1_9AGAR|nr:hypothetical protein DXG03_005976 [Asterophora parasitica]